MYLNYIYAVIKMEVLKEGPPNIIFIYVAFPYAHSQDLESSFKMSKSRFLATFKRAKYLLKARKVCNCEWKENLGSINQQNNLIIS